MKIIVGLGNYGDKYAYTYHNMGFLTAEALADRLGIRFKKRECQSLVGEGFVKGEKVVIALPQTYMNLSGVAVKQLLCKHKADLSDLIVIFDDVDIPKGSIRYRESGSGGTHNGMRNIIAQIGTTEFKRMRIGIKKEGEMFNLADYVLSEVPKSERGLLVEAIEKAVDKILEII